jgi:hypothetical protein
MPNHCHNKLTITGLQGVTKFINDHKCDKSCNLDEEVFSFEVVAPVNSPNLYDSHINSWGTKWDAYEVRVLTNDPDLYILTFDTAWSPPLNYMPKVSTKYTDLLFELEYEEEGCDFYGLHKYKNGELVSKTKKTYCHHILEVGGQAYVDLLNRQLIPYLHRCEKVHGDDMLDTVFEELKSKWIIYNNKKYSKLPTKIVPKKIETIIEKCYMFMCYHVNQTELQPLIDSQWSLERYRANLVNWYIRNLYDFYHENK